MIRLGEFDVVALIFYNLILLAIVFVAQIEGGTSVLDPTFDHCLKYCNQDCAKYPDSVMFVSFVGKPVDIVQTQREECKLALWWCECNPDPRTWGLDCRRHCHHCKLLIFTRRKVRCEEENRRCDCGPTLIEPFSGDNRLWASYGRPGISLCAFIVVMSLMLCWKRHVQAKNQIEIGNRRRPLRNERQRININNSRTYNTSSPPTTSTEPIIPREASSAETRAENGQQASIHRQTSLVDIAPPPEYEPPPPYPGIAKPGK